MDQNSLSLCFLDNKFKHASVSLKKMKEVPSISPFGDHINFQVTAVCAGLLKVKITEKQFKASEH